MQNDPLRGSEGYGQMKTLISEGTVLTPKLQLPDHTLTIENKKIVSVEAGKPSSIDDGDILIDARSWQCGVRHHGLYSRGA